MYRRKSTPGKAYRNVARTAYRAATAVAAGYNAYKKVKDAAKGKPKYASKTRTASKTTTVTRRRKVQEGEQSVYSKQNVSLGRPERHNLRNAWKKITANTIHNTLRINQYSQFAGTSGANNLTCISPTTSTGPMTLPCVLYDITSSPNMINGAAIVPSVRWIPTLSTPLDTGVITWANDTLWTQEGADTNGSAYTSIYAGASETLDWVQAKMMFYAPLTVPCRFQIDIVQITDTRLIPQTGTVPDGTFHTSFWQAMLKRFIYSPLETGDPKYKKYLKVLHTTSFILNPKETTDATNTVFRELNIFKRFNRTCKYDWQDQDKMNMLLNEGQINLDGAMSTYVHPRARIFVMVRAQARNGTAYSSNIHPSFDIMLRKRCSQFSS